MCWQEQPASQVTISPVMLAASSEARNATTPAMSAPAIEFKSEGFIAGVGTKLFAIAGPVIVYGVSASVIYGAVLWALHLMGITLF